MSRKVSREHAEYLVVGALLVVAIIVVAASRRTTPGTTFYHVAREAVHGRVDRNKIARFVPPFELRLEKINDRSTNVYGWFVYTNSTREMSTQWFRCTVEYAAANDIDLLHANPLQDNPTSRAGPK